jgi:hypothetical protein
MIAADARTSPPHQYLRPANALQPFRNSFGNFAIFTAIRRASSR